MVKHEVHTTDVIMRSGTVPAIVVGDSHTRQSRRRTLERSDRSLDRDHMSAEIDNLRHELRQTADAAERGHLEQRITYTSEARTALAEQRYSFEIAAKLV